MKQRMNYLTYILAGIRNKPGRNIATAFCFAFIAANIFSGQYLISGAVGSVDQGVSRMGADQIVVPAQYLVFFRGIISNNTGAMVRAEASEFRVSSNIMDKIGEIEGVDAMSPQLYVSTLKLSDLSSEPVDIFGFDPDTDFTIQPWLRHPSRNPPGQGEVLVGSGIKGDELQRIEIAGKTYTIAGRLDPTQSAVDRTVFLRLDDAYALASINGVVPPGSQRITPGQINAVMLRLEPGEDPNAVSAKIKRLFAPTFVTVIGKHFSLAPASRDIQGLPDLLNVISAVVVVAALPLIALIAAMVAHERQREIGLLKSMGATRKVIFSLIFAESLFLSATGGVAGVGVSLIAFTVLNSLGLVTSALQVSFRMPDAAELGVMAAMALLIVVTIGSIAALYPAYQSSMINPYDAIRREGR
jgi:putative ABC transport system permease protein